MRFNHLNGKKRLFLLCLLFLSFIFVDNNQNITNINENNSKNLKKEEELKLSQDYLTLINGSLDFFKREIVLYVYEPKNFTFTYLNKSNNQLLTNLDNNSYFWQKYDSKGEIILKGNGTLLESSDNTHILDLNTETLTIGDYSIYVYLKKEGYDGKGAFIDLHILHRPTLLNNSENLEIIEYDMFVGEIVNFSFSYVDKLTNNSITHLSNYSYFWKKFNEENLNIKNGTGNIILNEDNLFFIDFFNQSINYGKYFLHLIFNSENYTPKVVYIMLNIYLREISFLLGNNFRNNQINVIMDNAVNLDLTLFDSTRENTRLENATVLLIINKIEYNFTEISDGLYRYKFNTENIQAFFSPQIIIAEIKILKDGYILKEFNIEIIVHMKEILPGIPTWYLINIILAFLGVFGVIFIYRYKQIHNKPKKLSKTDFADNLKLKSLL